MKLNSKHILQLIQDKVLINKTQHRSFLNLNKIKCEFYIVLAHYSHIFKMVLSEICSIQADQVPAIMVKREEGGQ